METSKKHECDFFLLFHIGPLRVLIYPHQIIPGFLNLPILIRAKLFFLA
jgi:hypothetical protein